MQVDVAFEFAKVYDVNRIDVVKGEKFKLLTDIPPAVKDYGWFANKDVVLEVDDTVQNADVIALEVGTSMILIMDGNQNILKRLTISVVDAILPLAKSLGLSADTPKSK